MPLPPLAQVRTVLLDWEGTARGPRGLPPELLSCLEHLNRLGVDLVILAESDPAEVASELPEPRGPGGIFIASLAFPGLLRLNRSGTHVLLEKPVDPNELEAVKGVGARVRQALAEGGMRTELAPFPAGVLLNLAPDLPTEPTKRPHLLSALAERLARTGLAGLHQIAGMVRDEAARVGARLRVLPELPHLRLSLATKGDLARLALEALLGEDEPEGMLTLADEFGPLGGLPGPDFFLLEGLAASGEGLAAGGRFVFVSVGLEPEGVPDPVLPLGGGPETTVQVLRRLAEEVRAFPEPWPDPRWCLTSEGYDPNAEADRESWFTVSNGRMGTRGSLEEGAEESRPATYLAGLFGRPEAEGAQPVLVPGPDWVHLEPRVAGERLDLDRGSVIEHTRVLDMRRGILFRLWRHRLPSGREARFRSLRMASLRRRGLSLLQAELESDSVPGLLSDSIPVVTLHPAAETVRAEARGRGVRVEVRPRGGTPGIFAIQTSEEEGRLARVLSACRGTGPAVEERVERELEEAVQAGPAVLRAEHEAEWRRRWRSSDIRVVGDDRLQQALRFALYHLISAVDPEEKSTSVGARGLTGPGYHGHVFWDTEVFVLPFYAFTWPEAARALLSFRYRTLPAARARARRHGFRGALYPWEAADTGEDVTPPTGIGPDGKPFPIRTGEQEHHISADVAWAAWFYWEATRDEEWLLAEGAEIILETARFWTSRATLGRDGRYHIRKVIGPDEYHEGVTDDAFTNAAAAWNLRKGAEVAELLSGMDPAAWRALSRRLGLRAKELAKMERVASGLVPEPHPESGVYEQFRGYFALKDVLATDLHERPFAGEAVLGLKRLARSQLIKQADVLMIPFLLPEAMDDDLLAANYAYYEPRTCHGSSLSPPVHAALAARLGRLDEALSYLRMAASVDLGNSMANAALGVHLGSMGGMWQTVVRGFGGLRVAEDAILLDPKLPPGWEELCFTLLWRGTRVTVKARQEAISITLDSRARMGVGSQPPSLIGPGRVTWVRRAGAWERAQELDRGGREGLRDAASGPSDPSFGPRPSSPPRDGAGLAT